MSINRRSFIKNLGMSLASVSLNARDLSLISGGSESLLVKNRDQPIPSPKGYDRLPLSWYKSRVQKLKDQLDDNKVEAILLEKDVNKVYFSG